MATVTGLMDSINRMLTWLASSLSHINRALAWLACGLIRGYRLLLSPLVGWHCRFYPTCSAYALAAYSQYGWAKGTCLTLQRLLKCHPWHAGGCDELPSLTSPTKPPEGTVCKPNNVD